MLPLVMECVLQELLYAGDSVLVSEAIDGLGNKVGK